MACDNWIFYPREQCPTCFSSTLEWAPVSGRGRVYAYTIVSQPADRAFEGDAPYVYAIVQLDEGVRMPTNIIGIAPEDVQVDMPVTVVFDDVSAEWTLPKFTPKVPQSNWIVQLIHAIHGQALRRRGFECLSFRLTVHC